MGLHHHKKLLLLPVFAGLILAGWNSSRNKVCAGTILNSAIRVSRNSLKESEHQLRVLVDESGDEPYLLTQLGRVLFRQGQESLAIKLWDRAAKSDANQASSKVEIVFAKIAAREYGDASALLEHLAPENPTDPHELIAAAELAVATQRFDNAEQLFEKSHELSPEIGATNIAMGHLHELKGDPDSAESFYERATELVPKQPEAWIKLGNMQFRENRIEKALVAFSKAEKCLGRQPLAETRLAELYFLNSNHFLAHRFFQLAIDRDEKDPFPRVRLAQVLERAGYTEESRLQYEKVLESSEYPTALQSLARLELVENRLNEARDLYRRIIAIDPDDVLACNNLAMILVQLEESPSEALSLIEHAIETSTGTPDHSLLSTHGCVLCFAEEFEESETVLSSAVQHQPNLSWNRYCYGLALQRNGKTEQAREQFEACLWLDADFPKKNEIQKHLEN